MKRLYSVFSALAVIILLFSGCGISVPDSDRAAGTYFEYEAQEDNEYSYSEAEESSITINKANAASSTVSSAETETTESAETTKSPQTATTALLSTTSDEKTTKSAKPEKSSSTQQSVEHEKNSGMVWIPNSGSKFHKTSTCSGMKNPSHVTIDAAKAKGFTACKKCYK